MFYKGYTVFPPLPVHGLLLLQCEPCTSLEVLQTLRRVRLLLSWWLGELVSCRCCCDLALSLTPLLSEDYSNSTDYHLSHSNHTNQTLAPSLMGLFPLHPHCISVSVPLFLCPFLLSSLWCRCCSGSKGQRSLRVWVSWAQPPVELSQGASFSTAHSLQPPLKKY